MREPPSKFRQPRNEEMRARFQADVAELFSSLEIAQKRFPCDIPPLALLSVSSTDAHRQLELSCRQKVDETIRHWLATKEWPEVAASHEFWLAARFEHAFWLAHSMICPDRDGISRYVPTYAGELLSGFREWLLIHTWAHAGCDRFLADLTTE